MQNGDYPPLFEESDRLAIISQKRHYLLVRVKVALLTIVAFILSIVLLYSSPLLRITSGLVVASLLIVITAISAFMQTKNFDEDWADFRITAESIKSETWLFMMHTREYGRMNMPQNYAETTFIDKLSEIAHIKQSIEARLSLDLKQDLLITNKMTEMRNLTLQDRFNYYVQDRIGNQREWYKQKAKWNSRRETFWFLISWAFELLACILAVAIIVYPNSLVDPVEIVTAAGAGILLWLNARNYREPAESYGIVSEKLLLVKNKAALKLNTLSSTDQASLDNIVEETEATINSEQRIWLARL